MRTLRVLPLVIALITIALREAEACPNASEQGQLRKALLAEWKITREKEDYFAVVGPNDPKAPCLGVLSVREQGDCHACGTTISVIEVARVGTAWTRGLAQRSVAEIGAFGRAPAPTWVKARVPLLRFDTEDMHQGIVTTGMTLVAKVDGSFKPVLSVMLVEDNSASGEDTSWGWKATPRFIPGDGPLPTLELTYSGTQSDGKSIDLVETWEFRDSEYVKKPTADGGSK